MTADAPPVSALEQLRELAARLPRGETIARRNLASVIWEVRRRERAGDGAFTSTLTRALLVSSLVWVQDSLDTVTSLHANSRSAAEQARDGITRVYDEDIGPLVERGVAAEMKQRRASEAGAAAKKARAAAVREKLLRGETVHLSKRAKRRHLNGK